MDREKAIEIIRKELLCVDRDTCKREECKSCDLVMPSKEPIIEAYKMAIKALEQEHILDKIRAEIKQNSYPIVHGVNNHEFGMTLYGILQVLDKYKYKAESEVEE